MPRGSAPGERRGGRSKGTPNKATAARLAAMQSAAQAPSEPAAEPIPGAATTAEISFAKRLAQALRERAER